MKHAVIGSREGVPPDKVALAVNRLYTELGEFILVSGYGKVGSVNRVAETTALEFGIPVLSFRPCRLANYGGIDPQFGVLEHRLHRGGESVVQHAISFADWRSAAQYRSMLIVERAEAATIFRNAGFSPGTDFEIEMFANASKPTTLIQA